MFKKGGALGFVGDLFRKDGPLQFIGDLFADGGALSFISSAIPYIGAAISAASFIVPLIVGLFKKTPRLDIDFDTVQTELGDRAAVVEEFLDEDFFKDNIARISVKRSAGLGVGGDDKIKEIIQETLENTINTVLDIINKLPTDLADRLTEQLLSAEVDTETVVKGERLLEFDAKGKKIKEKFETFINGQLQAKFLFAVRDFFVGAFEQLGVLPGAASSFVEQEFEKYRNAGSREERAQIGQEFLASFSAFVDAFNIIEGNINDAIGETIGSVNSLSRTLGFDAVPSLDELGAELEQLLQNAELDPETVQKYVELRNAIVSVTSEIVSSISSLIGKISQLNGTITGFGGSAVDLTGFLDTAAAQVQGFLSANIGNLSLSEQEGLLDELTGLANQQLAEERAAFQRAQQAAQRAAEAQKEAVQRRIDGLNEEKDRIREAYDERIDALNEELRIAEDFASLTESIRQTLDSILFSPESVLTGVEQVNAIQSNIAGLQQELAGTSDPERQVEIVGRLEDAFKTLFDTAGEAFGVNSPEFVAIFDQVTGGLESLAALTETRGRSVEEINTEIERLTAEQNARIELMDARIEALQDRLSEIGTRTAENTFQASQKLQELFEYIRSEYVRILEERFEQLGEVSEYGFKTEVEGLGAIAEINDEQLTVLRSIEELFRNVQGFAEGTGGLIRDFGRGTLAVLHGNEAVLTESQLVDLRAGLIDQFVSTVATGSGVIGQASEMHVDINVNVNGGSGGAVASLSNEIENMLVRSIRHGGRLRSAIQEAGAKRLN